MRLRTVDFKRLARWCRNARSMAKSCLPKSASQIEVDGLSKAIRLGTEYGLGIIDGRTTGLLNAAQGTYTHECIKRNLATLPERYKVQNCMIEIPSPGLPSLEVGPSTYKLQAILVIAEGILEQVHLLCCRGSLGSFPSPRNLTRYLGGYGIVSHLLFSSPAGLTEM